MRNTPFILAAVLAGSLAGGLAAMGATPGDVACHCAVGKAEMAKASAIGTLLR